MGVWWCISLSCLILFSFSLDSARCLNNGLAIKPPMGWISWIQYGCNTNCTAYPKICLNEENLRGIADHMASNGYKDAGYNYIVVDDCWLSKERGLDGRQIPDAERFPSGIKNLSDYIHSKGLKFGLYTDIGLRTCAGYPGSQFYLELDADTYASWGVDYLKVDGCNGDTRYMQEGYGAMGFFLNRTGRSILYSCEWPAYQLASLIAPNYSAIRSTCNMWRSFMDMQPSWKGVLRVLSFWAIDLFGTSKFAGPGGWNDPDVLVVGNYALTPDQEALQMSMWAMIAAPLMMSADLRNVTDDAQKVLKHSGIIAISQDPLGIQGTLVKAVGMLQFWRRPLSPVGSRFAAAILNLDPSDGKEFETCLTDFNFPSSSQVEMFDVLQNRTVCSNCHCSQIFLRPTSVVLMTLHFK